MRLKIFMIALTSTANLSAQNDADTAIVFNRELEGVTVVAHNEIRKLREAAMPITVLGTRQLEGTATNINDALARTAGITVRNTGGMGSASRISVRGLEGKRMGVYIDEMAIGQLSDYLSLNDVPTDMIERIEIYKGIVPYRFGGSALGGAVNVVTKEYPPVYLDASYEIASFNTHKMNFAFKRTNAEKGLQFGLGGVLTYSDNDYKMQLQNLDNRIVKRDHDQFQKMMVGGSLKATKWYFDVAKLELVFTATKAEIQGIDSDIREAYNHGMAGIVDLCLKRDNFLIDGLDFDFDGAYSYGKNGLCDKAMFRYDWDGNPALGVNGKEWNASNLGAFNATESSLTIPKEGTWLVITGHNSTGSLNTIWIVRAGSSGAHVWPVATAATATSGITGTHITATIGTVGMGISGTTLYGQTVSGGVNVYGIYLGTR